MLEVLLKNVFKTFNFIILYRFRRYVWITIEWQTKWRIWKIYDSDDVKTETNNITVTLKREDGTWNLSGDKDEITNAILPGYSDISSELNNISE